MKKSVLITIIAVLGFLKAGAQIGQSYGGPATDYGYETEATADGGFVVAGLTDSYGAGSSDYWLVKFDSLGNKVWSKTFGTTSYEQIYCLRLAADGGYLLAGYSGIYGSGNEGALMYKIAADGQVVWTKTIHLVTRDHSHALFENFEGGYYMAGHTESTGNAAGAMWVVKMDSARNILWDSSYTPINTSEHAHAAALTPDSGLIVLGHTDKYTYTNFRLLKLDKNGVLQWSQIYRSGSTNNDTPYEVRVTRQGNYAMFGYSETSSEATFWLKVVDTAGNSLIDKHYGSGFNYCWSGRQTADDGFLMIGYKSPGNIGYDDMIIFKTDLNGNLQWTKQYGGTGDDDGYGFTPFHKNKYVLTGGTVSFSSGGGQDLWVVLVDSLGNLINYPMIITDAGIKNVLQPTGINCSAEFDPVVTLKNSGVDTLTSVYIYFMQDNNLADSFVWTGSLSSTGMDTVALPVQNTSQGLHTFTVWTGNPNGTIDLNPANDTATITFYMDTSTQPVPFSEGFENDSLPPPNWKMAGTTSLFSIDTTGGFGNSLYGLRADFFHLSSGTAFLLSPFVDLTTTALPITLSFSLAYPSTGSSSYYYRDTLKVSVSDDCSSTWSILYAKADTTLATAPTQNSQFVPNATSWRTDYINLDSFAGRTIQVRFEAKSGFGNELYLDDININSHFITESSTLSVSAEKFFITAYPNPATGWLTVEVPYRQGKIFISLLNMLGQTLYFSDIEKEKITLDIAALPSGIYMLRATNGKNVAEKKISIVR